MKYKVTGLLAAVVMLALILVIAFFDQDQEIPRYHQHQSARQPQEGCSCDGSQLCTHLPLVIIDTGGEKIPGEPIQNGQGKTTFTVAADGSDTIDADLRIVDHEDKNNHPGDEADLESRMEIRVRGNSSRYFDKKSYLLKLTSDSGEKKREESVMGMDKFDEWILYGPYLDKSLIRNYMWYNIAGEIMDYAPNVRFCEVIVNDKYQGLYLMVESIDSSESARLKLSEPEDDATQVSFALRLDRGSSNPLRNISSFTQYAYRTLQAMDIVYPRPSELTADRRRYIENSFSDFEKSLYSYDYDTGEYKWQNWADEDSFIDYFLLNEFTCNYDAGSLSTYIYKDVRGKYRMCIWDFNSACDNYENSVTTPQRFELQGSVWFYMLMKDEDFVNGVIDRYRSLRETYFSDDYIDRYIDETIDYLGPAVERNFQVWGYTFKKEMIKPAERNPESHEEAVQQIKDFCHERGEWMDENIETLLQYCHESKVKKFNH